MADKLKVLIVASEVVPFAKTGGLADVTGALPKELAKLGCELRAFMPDYGLIEDNFKLKKVRNLAPLKIAIGENVEEGYVKTTRLDDSDVGFYFLESKKYYGRSMKPSELYVDPETKKDYKDNDERFIFLSRGALEFLKATGWKVDVIHCNDWQSGLIPAYLKTFYAGDPFFKGISTLYSVHNLSYQGLFKKDTLYKAGFTDDFFYPTSPFEFYGRVNFMKAGLVYSDIINTVSKKYAQEIQTKEYGCGLEGVLADRREDLYGVLNGIDYGVWSPEIDDLIPAKYSRTDLSGKKRCKEFLLKKSGLPVPKEDLPLIGSISRLVDQKGFDLIAEVIDEIMSLDLQFVLLGTGEPKYHSLFEDLRKRYPEKAGIHLTFNNQLAHEIEAGADMFLMPSRYEPCGLNQLYSLKYGTIPIVRSTGGLADTIDDFDPQKGSGNGFAFEEYSSQELLKALERAIGVYRDKKPWRALIDRAMRADHSWGASASEYVKLYRKAIAKVRGSC